MTINDRQKEEKHKKKNEQEEKQKKINSMKKKKDFLLHYFPMLPMQQKKKSKTTNETFLQQCNSIKLLSFFYYLPQKAKPTMKHFFPFLSLFCKICSLFLFHLCNYASFWFWFQNRINSVLQFRNVSLPDFRDQSSS